MIICPLMSRHDAMMPCVNNCALRFKEGCSLAILAQVKNEELQAVKAMVTAAKTPSKAD